MRRTRRISRLGGGAVLGIGAVVGLGAWSARSTASVLVPGSSELSTSHLSASSSRFHYFTRASADSAEKRTDGVGSQSVSATTHDGKPALLLVTGFVRGDRTFADTALVMRDGLHPVWEVATNGTRRSRWEYSGKRVRLTFTQPDSGTRTREHTYDVPVFHFNELDVLIRSLPLREGFEAILPLYSEGSDELEMDTVRVSARGADGVWPVRFADPAIVSTYGIDGTTRRIVRYEVLSRRNGALSRRVEIE